MDGKVEGLILLPKIHVARKKKNGVSVMMDVIAQRIGKFLCSCVWLLGGGDEEAINSYDGWMDKWMSGRMDRWMKTLLEMVYPIQHHNNKFYCNNYQGPLLIVIITYIILVTLLIKLIMFLPNWRLWEESVDGWSECNI